jgi:hypothetical protein
MQTQKHGKWAVVTAAVSIALAVSDYSGFAEKIAAVLGVDPKNLPIAYLTGFLVALLLLRKEYETADYDFIVDPKTEYLREGDYDEPYCYHDTYRITVINRGHSPITAQVLLRGISPELCEFTGKLGMPLIAMGEPPTTEPIQINSKDRRAFNLVTHQVDASYPQDNPTDRLTLWHKWATAPRELPVYDKPIYVDYTFELDLSVAEGPVKTAQYLLRRSTQSDRDYQLTRVRKRSLLARFVA